VVEPPSVYSFFGPASRERREWAEGREIRLLCVLATFVPGLLGPGICSPMRLQGELTGRVRLTARGIVDGKDHEVVTALWCSGG